MSNNTKTIKNDVLVSLQARKSHQPKSFKDFKDQQNEVFQIEWIPIKDLDPAVWNVTPEDARVKEIKKYNKYLMKPLIVGVLPDGTMIVLDGHHRATAYQELGYPEIPCVFIQISSPEEGAEWALLINVDNSKSGKKPYWKFVMELGFKDPMAVDLQRVVESVGFKISPNSGNYRITVIPAIKGWQKQHGLDVVKLSLMVIRDVYDGHPVALQLKLWKLIIDFISRYSKFKQFDYQRLIKVLRTSYGTDAVAFTKEIESEMRKCVTTEPEDVVNILIHKKYNHQLGEAKKLPKVDR